MKINLMILIASFSVVMSVKGQNFFFIGENSYPCTETITLKSNSDKYYINDLDVIIAKDVEKLLIVVSTETTDVLIQGKLIIYLDDGNVIILKDNGIHDYVDKIASNVYYLDYEELSLIKKSNINSVRYSLKGKSEIETAAFGGDFSASNKGIQTKTLITDFFGE